MERKEFESYVEEKMKKIDEALDKMGAHTDMKGRFEDLMKKYTDVRENFSQLKSTGADAFEDVKVGFQIAWSDLQDSMKSASDRLMSLGNQKEPTASAS